MHPRPFRASDIASAGLIFYILSYEAASAKFQTNYLNVISYSRGNN